MKKIFLFITITVLVSSQLFCASKKELEEKVNTLTIQNETLETRIAEAETQLKEKNKQIDELKNENQKIIQNLKEENTFLQEEIKEKISENEKILQTAFMLKGTLISDGMENGHKVLRRSYVDVIKTKWLVRKSISDIYKNPVIDGKPIGSFSEGDTILSTELVLVDSYDLFLKIIAGSVSGYILLDTHETDWFKDNKNMFLKYIETPEETYTVRQTNLKKSLQSEDQIKYQETPGKSGKIIGSFPFKNKFSTIPVTVTAYTTDLKWIFVENEQGQGWVSAKTLSSDIGGPKIPTPEWNLIFYLVDQP